MEDAGAESAGGGEEAMIIGISGASSTGHRGCRLAPAFPELSSKSKTRIRNQTLCVAAAVIGCVFWNGLVSLASGRVPAATDEVAEVDQQSAAARALHAAHDCATQCAGEWMPRREADRQEQLKKEFLMIEWTHLDYRDEEKLLEPRIKKDKIGWIVVYVFLIVWMFAALAIVCDEFFVPSLEAFVDDFGISMDVAGATFMAAGGSMPELFTSFISTFREAAQVGMAAIVGSAVFNVLFVIAVCAIFNKEDALQLTWWPLARDCTFYVIALATVVMVFQVSSPKKIEAWEAILLLCEYIMYCSFMKVNGAVQDWVMSKLERVRPKDNQVYQVKPTATVDAATTESIETGDDNKPDVSPGGKPDVSPRGGANSSMASSTGSIDSQQMTASQQMTRFASDPPALEKRQRGIGGRKLTSQSERGGPAAKLNMPSMFRQGIVQLMTKNAALSETAGMAAVMQIKGNLEDTFRKLDVNEDGMLSPTEIRLLLDKMGVKHDSAALETALRRLTHTGDSAISFEVFKQWYLCSEARVEIEVRRVFDTYDRNGDQTLDKTEIPELLRALGHKPTEKEIDELIAAVCQPVGLVDSSPDGGGPPPPETEAPDLWEDKDEKAETQPMCITYEQFEAWYTSSLFFRHKLKQQELQVEAAEEEGITLDPPDDPSWRNMTWYVCTYPLVAMLYCTLPDVRKEKFAKSDYHTWIAIVEFVLSLVWIGIFSNLLFECTVVVSNTIGIPTAVSAVTVLAAGTSIPDLISSYIVARNGEGDMAVSSSIGSNIFDVTVGLPLPWLCYNVVKGSKVAVSSKSLGPSIVLLILMLVAVITTIVVNKWKLTKTLGYVMMLLYIVFLTLTLLQELPAPDGLIQVD